MLQAGALIRDVKVRELIAMVAALHPHPLDVDEALELAGLTDIAGRRTHKLSGGQAQRVRFAVALVPDPAVLILDEPTVGMDVEARRAFWRSVRDFAARGKTVIFATHYLEEADAYADRAILMSHGRVVADGPTSEIRARVGTRTIRATLPEADLTDLASLPGRDRGGSPRRGDRPDLHGFGCRDPRAARRPPDARDMEIAGAGLEDAFIELTGNADETTAADERQEALV